MGLFSRLGALIKSNLNDLISKAEDPEKMLTQVLVDMMWWLRLVAFPLCMPESSFQSVKSVDSVIVL